MLNFVALKFRVCSPTTFHNTGSAKPGISYFLAMSGQLISSHGSCLIDRLHGRVVKGLGHIGHDEVMEAGGREFDPRPGHYSRMSF